ncbi:hypothetical protein FRC08_017911 [Ceratobasidium sp. 394]|nr:hypothetical protein FRC08_017911 [Ceratobasidium sp. 394]
MNSATTSLGPNAGRSQGQPTLHPKMSMSLLPTEIWGMILSFSSLEDRARIARLNHWFYNAFGKTLYQDIYLHTPLQLLKLFQSPKAADNLAETRRLTFKRGVLWVNSLLPDLIEFESDWYLVRVLHMTTSLRELYIEDCSSAPFDCGPDCESELEFRSEIINRATNDPSFLPHLARIESPDVWNLAPLCRVRPIEHLSNTPLQFLVANRPGNEFHPAGASPTRISLDTSAFQYFNPLHPSSQDVALQLEGLARRGVTVRHLRVVGIRWEQPRAYRGPSLDLPSWVMGLARAYGHEHLESLCVTFEPPVEKQPTVSVQLQTLEQATHRRKSPDLI